MIYDPSLDLNDPFTFGLACAALQPGLRSVLVYDVPPPALQATATRLSNMLCEVIRREVVIVNLGANEAEDDLWGSLTLQQKGRSSQFAWRPGRLVSISDDQRLRLVVIPNIAQLSLPATRACLALIGAEVAYLERHGQDITWAPDFCWLAGCDHADIGQLSPHLLDRFTLRLSSPKNALTNQVADIVEWLTCPPLASRRELTELPISLREQLRSAALRYPVLDKAVIAHILEYFSEAKTIGARREIALGRLAIAHAQLSEAQLVTSAHVDAAAALIGLRRIGFVHKDLQATSRIHEKLSDEVMVELQVPHEPASESNPTEALTVSSEGTPVYISSVEETLPLAQMSTPYLEDMALVNREFVSLQLPPHSYRVATTSSSAIIGIEPATSLHDIALVSTILEAAKFQKVRRKNSLERVWNGLLAAGTRSDHQDLASLSVPFPNRLLISAVDLRSYRRASAPERMLVLVLDYTCFQDCDWEEIIYPQLRWAYVMRASMCLIQVGAATAAGPAKLCAQQIIAPSILAPRIRNALMVGPGEATPLAHGLDLAVQALRKAMQHGRSKVYQARLVVLSDGRGNVPLEASRTGKIEWPITREGIEDSLHVARSVQRLKNVEVFLLNPQPHQYPGLPIALAEALGATLIESGKGGG